jgi:Zn-dependent peptidase ImmA (M78 family)
MIDRYKSNDVIESLEDVAYKNGITILDVYDLDKSTSDCVIMSVKTVFMNYSYDKVSYAFRLAHEISHILFGNPESQNVYYFSECGKRGEELEAHKNAIEMLMKIKRPTTVQTFMEAYSIPSWLSEYVEIDYRRNNEY